MKNEVYVFEGLITEYDYWDMPDVNIKIFSDSVAAIAFYQTAIDSVREQCSEYDSVEIEIDNSEEEYFAEFRTEECVRIFRLYSTKLLTSKDIAV